MFISCTSNKFSIYFIIIQIFKECGTLFSNMTSEDGAKCPDGRTKSWKIQWTNESLPEDRNSHNPTPWRVGSANTSRWVSELIKTSDCLYLECWGLEGLITSLFFCSQMSGSRVAMPEESYHIQTWSKSQGYGNRAWHQNKDKTLGEGLRLFFIKEECE